jgi:hypothetical protein|tara:strand:+ start:52 stop:237 length:186 start_codon:yes stop_codon:yes gene_type:complete
MISENKVILIISSIAATLIGVMMVQKFIEYVEFDYLLFLCFLVFLAQILFYGNKLKKEKNK